MRNNDYTISAVIKALKALKQFSATEKEMTLTEISNKCNLTKSSMLRILESLAAEDFIKYDEDKKKYRLGIALYNLGNTAYEFLDIKKIASPILKQAAIESQLLIHLAVIEDYKVIVIDKVFPSDHLDMIALVSYVGGSVPLHATGVGKVLSAYSSDKKLDKLIANCDFKKYTERTITTVEDFKKELDNVKRSGFAFNDCEHEPYLRCITRPIVNSEGNVIAALSLSGLKDVITDDKFEFYNEISKNTARAVSREFGYRQ